MNFMIEINQKRYKKAKFREKFQKIYEFKINQFIARKRKFMNSLRSSSSELKNILKVNQIGLNLFFMI